MYKSAQTSFYLSTQIERRRYLEYARLSHPSTRVVLQSEINRASFNLRTMAASFVLGAAVSAAAFLYIRERVWERPQAVTSRLSDLQKNIPGVGPVGMVCGPAVLMLRLSLRCKSTGLFWMSRDATAADFEAGAASRRVAKNRAVPFRSRGCIVECWRRERSTRVALRTTERVVN